MCVVCALSDASLMRPFLSQLIIGISQFVYRESRDKHLYLNTIQITDDNQDIKLYFTKNSGKIGNDVPAKVSDAVQNMIVEYVRKSKSKANSSLRSFQNDHGRDVMLVHLSFPDL